MKWVTVLVALAVMGCEKGGDDPSRSKSAQEGNGKTLVGIWPKEWTCDRIATAQDITAVLGANARVVESPVLPPDGVPRPCNYLVDGPNGAEAWTFDLDCRDGYKTRADALFAQYTQTSAELVSQYNAAADAAPGPTPPKPPKPDPSEPPADAAPPRRAPEAAHEVAVGARGLDHHGQGLLFIDDDSPCYVRVVGPDADRRLALALHVVARLTPATAPMTPRASQ